MPIRSWHSVAASGSELFIALKSGNIWSIIAMPSAACAIRGSVYCVAASGGGVGACDSQVRSDRNCGSLATSWPNAVVPGAGQPEDDHRAVDDLVGDLRMLLVGVDRS